MFNIGRCNYPMYQQLTQSRSSDLSTGGPPLVTVHLSTFISTLCDPDTERRWSAVDQAELYLEKFPRYSYFDDPTELWLTAAPGVAIGRCRIIKCQYPHSPLRGSIIVYIYNLYLVCHYLIREKNSARDRGHSSERRRL